VSVIETAIIAAIAKVQVALPLRGSRSPFGVAEGKRGRTARLEPQYFRITAPMIPRQTKRSSPPSYFNQYVHTTLSHSFLLASLLRGPFFPLDSHPRLFGGSQLQSKRRKREIKNLASSREARPYHLRGRLCASIKINIRILRVPSRRKYSLCPSARRPFAPADTPIDRQMYRGSLHWPTAWAYVRATARIAHFRLK
jgi:hypothetical protein